MAKVWFSVIFLVLSYQVVAAYRECVNLDMIRNCDECIRCGAHWCNNPKEARHCSIEKHDDWCTGNQEKLWRMDNIEEPGTHFNSKYTLRTVTIGRGDDVSVTYPASGANKVELTYTSTQSSDYVQISNDTSCSDDKMCTTTVEATPTTKFCAKDGRLKEFVTVKLNVKGVQEESKIDFHVPCACKCSETAEKKSTMCSGRGSYSCGVCDCDQGWEGNFCELESCDAKRGDIPCSDGSCSGNGICGRCDRCECYTDRPGSRYFHRDNFCAGICATTNDCEDCFLNNTMGRCEQCYFDFYRHAFNETKLEERDSLGRQLWVGCNHTVRGCQIKYAAMEDDNSDTHYMIIGNSCDPLAAGYVGTVNLTLPLVLGIGAVLLVGLAAAAYAVWVRPGPDQAFTPDYQTVGAEGCTGENPLYKPPTSSFKNPTYGKL